MSTTSMPASTSSPEKPFPVGHIRDVQPQDPAKLTRLSRSDPGPQTSDELAETLLACLPKTGVARPTVDLREQVGRRKAHVIKALRRLQDLGLIERTKAGWRRVRKF